MSQGRAHKNPMPVPFQTEHPHCLPFSMHLTFEVQTENIHATRRLLLKEISGKHHSVVFFLSKSPAP